MEIRLDDVTVATTMRTPGHDYELAVGFCHSEGLLVGTTVQGVRYCAVTSAAESEFNVVSVETGGGGPVPVARIGPVNSACGVCGSAQLDDLTTRLSPIPDGPAFSAERVGTMASEIQARQELFAKTGAVHAAALVAPDGELLMVREDIGRHNAVDKVVGRVVLDDSAVSAGQAMFVSSRASFEMVQKAWALGVKTLIAVSAPSALAIATATRANMTLVGFVRSDSLNVYAGSLS